MSAERSPAMVGWLRVLCGWARQFRAKSVAAIARGELHEAARLQQHGAALHAIVEACNGTAGATIAPYEVATAVATIVTGELDEAEAEYWAAAIVRKAADDGLPEHGASTEEEYGVFIRTLAKEIQNGLQMAWGGVLPLLEEFEQAAQVEGDEVKS